MQTAHKNRAKKYAAIVSGQLSKPLLEARMRIFFVWQKNRLMPIFIG